jgi:Uri superfamily endonuclease
VIRFAFLPKAPGTYIVWFHLEKEQSLRFRSAKSRVLPPGGYAYCGSAKGPGGLRARLGRHLRPFSGQVHWQVDALHQWAVPAAAFWTTASEKDEHCLAEICSQTGLRMIPRFGCSDCRCDSHLFFGGSNDWVSLCKSLMMNG